MYSSFFLIFKFNSNENYKTILAGLLIEGSTTTLYIDPLQNVANMEPFLGTPKFPIFPISTTKIGIARALITHIHQDHFDQPFLKELLANYGELWGPQPVYTEALKSNLKATIAKINETFTIGDFTITAVPAVDWIGDEQISYVISDGKHTILHGGESNWHGYWWQIAKNYGPFDATFLPVNGVVGAVPQVVPAIEMFGTMTPAQAVSATRILGSKQLIPMHYTQFFNPPLYTQFPDIDNALDNSEKDQEILIRRLKDGEILEL